MNTGVGEFSFQKKSWQRAADLPAKQLLARPQSESDPHRRDSQLSSFGVRNSNSSMSFDVTFRNAIWN